MAACGRRNRRSPFYRLGALPDWDCVTTLQPRSSSVLVVCSCRVWAVCGQNTVEACSSTLFLKVDTRLSTVGPQRGKSSFVSDLLFAVLAGLRVFFRSRLDASLEILVLCHQVAILRRKRRRVRLTRIDRLFSIAFRNSWSRWSGALVVVKPATVIAWHQAGFRVY